MKINSVLSHGGMPCVVKTVEELTGVTIPFAGIVQFMGVAGLSEADRRRRRLRRRAHRGRVHGHVPRRRHPHALGRRGAAVPAHPPRRRRRSDLGRISNQQVFLSSLARKLQSEGTLGDPVKLYSIAKAALANMQLSDSLMDPVRMISIAKALKDTDLAKIAFIQYPTGLRRGAARSCPPIRPRSSTSPSSRTSRSRSTQPPSRLAFASAVDPNAAAEPAAPTEEVPAEEVPPTETPIRRPRWRRSRAT